MSFEQSEIAMQGIASRPNYSDILKQSSSGPENDGLTPLDASRLTCVYNANSQFPIEMIPGERCTDHMITCEWTYTEGWLAPELKPHGPLCLQPTASCLHYATECFDGLKLYRGVDSKLRLFRPSLNAVRMLSSATSICLPCFSTEEWLKLVVKLCAVDGPKWLPKNKPGSFLYIRPTLIATDPSLGVKKPRSALLFIVLALFSNTQETMRVIKLRTSNENTVRAWPGGAGNFKIGGNYAPTILPAYEAQIEGFDQVLWLLRDEHGVSEVTEAGACNFMVVWRTRNGRIQMVTAPLDGNIILNGVTRRSVMELAKKRLCGIAEGDAIFEVLEERISIDDIVKACEEKRMIEAFVTGTAFFISPVSVIKHENKVLSIPTSEGNIGKYAKMLRSWMQAIMYGEEEHEWGNVVDE